MNWFVSTGVPGNQMENLPSVDENFFHLLVGTGGAYLFKWLRYHLRVNGGMTTKTTRNTTPMSVKTPTFLDLRIAINFN
jgi:hypothetical protein